MKTDTNEEISFTNSNAGIHLNKQEGAIALDFKSQEVVLYLNTSLYQSLAWLLQASCDTEKLMQLVTWTVDPKSASKSALIEVHGPDHSVCLVCSPTHERIQLNFEIGISIDLKFSDFLGLTTLIKEAQSDLEWRRQILQWTYCKHSEEHRSKDWDNKDKEIL